MALSFPAFGDALYLHTVSYHQDRDANYNEANYGLGVRHNLDDNYITGGFYDNSEDHTSAYVAYGWEWPYKGLKLGILAGLVTGYSMGNVLPFAVPVIRYKRAQLLIAPYPSAVVHLTIDVLRW